jgi:hypothetical protein
VNGGESRDDSGRGKGSYEELHVVRDYNEWLSFRRGDFYGREEEKGYSPPFL